MLQRGWEAAGAGQLRGKEAAACMRFNANLAQKKHFGIFWQFWFNLDSGWGKGLGCRNARGWEAKGHAAGGAGGCGGRAAERQRGQRALRPTQQAENDELRHPVANIIILSPTPYPTNEKRRTPMTCRQHYRPVANTMGIC